MLCIIKKIYQKTGSFTFFSVFLLVSFFCCFFVTNNSFATSVSLPHPQDLIICSSDCSDYSFISVNFDFPTPSLTQYSQIYVNGSSILRFNFLANQSSILNEDFYIPIPSSATSVSISFPNVTGTFNYEFLTSLSSGITPSGSISLTQNGSFDVTQYAEAVVDVPPEVIQGDYHDDLTNIYRAIITCGAILLVLYFFFCIYRVIIKTTGGF